ncbi:MAG: M20/M25/M40 family metallo-hydrolase, partial [Chloroflexota bacterium]
MTDRNLTGEATDLLQHLIRNRCVNDGTPASGGEIRSVETLAAYLAGPGVEMRRFEPIPGRGNLVVRIEGADPKAPTLCLMGHIDVVPASAEGWERDPFGGELVAGEVWGRGAIDMLGITASMAVATKRLLREGWRPRGTLVYLAVADEEALGTYGAQWMVEREWDSVRCDHLVTEFGGVALPIGGGRKRMLSVAEKGSHWTQLPAEKALKHLKEKVFPFLRTLGGAGGSFAEQMENAEFKINKPSLLIEVCRAIDEMQISAQNQDVQGDLYEYMLGHLNIAGALHPAVLKDGRVLFSSLESQGLRSSILWGIWSIHPDGTNWGPFISALLAGGGAPDAFHFQTQLSDGSVIVERYYNQNNSGFGGYYKIPPQSPDGYAAFGPADANDVRNPPLRAGRFENGKGKFTRIPFSPYGIESFTRFANFGEGLADRSIREKNDSPAVGKFTHPSGAPDNHLLTVYSPGPVNHQNGMQRPAVDGGLYLI